MFLQRIISMCFCLVLILSDGSYFIFGHRLRQVIGSTDLNVGVKVANFNDNQLENPEELGNYFEGDIILPHNGKNGLIKDVYRWPSGIVPFEIKGTFGIEIIYYFLINEIINHNFCVIKYR